MKMGIQPEQIILTANCLTMPIKNIIASEKYRHHPHLPRHTQTPQAYRRHYPFPIPSPKITDYFYIFCTLYLNATQNYEHMNVGHIVAFALLEE